MDKCVNDITLPREAALAAILERCRFHRKIQWIPAGEAYGRVLAEDCFSKHNLPNHLASNRDGVAVYFQRFAGGMPDTRDWKEGIDYVFSNTGVGIKGDFDTVILIEKVFFDEEGRISFTHVPAQKGEMTIPVGEELRKGERIALAGQTLTPSLLAMLAKGGHAMLPVVRRPVVSFLPTGSELVPPGESLPLRKNVDANSTLIRGKILEAGAEPVIFPISRDDPAVLEKALRQAVATSDIVVINAGSSKGTDDFNHEVMESMGEVINHQVNTGPGKHTSYAMVGEVPVVGLSGPTGCSDYTFDWYVRPLLDVFLGRPQTKAPCLQARILTDLHRDKKGVLFMMGARVFLDEERQPVVVPAAQIDDQKAIEGKVNCFIPLEYGEKIQAGDWVEVELRWPFAMPRQEPETMRMVMRGKGTVAP